MFFPNSLLHCRTYPRPSDVYLSPLSRLPLPFISPAHRRPSTTQIYLARSSDSFSVITSELYVVSLPQIIWVCPDIYDGKICKVYQVFIFSQRRAVDDAALTNSPATTTWLTMTVWMPPR